MTPASGKAVAESDEKKDAVMPSNRPHIARLQSLLDRLKNDAYSAQMFEGDGDTIRDAIALAKRYDEMIRRHLQSTTPPQSRGGGGEKDESASIPENAIQMRRGIDVNTPIQKRFLFAVINDLAEALRPFTGEDYDQADQAHAAGLLLAIDCRTFVATEDGDSHPSDAVTVPREPTQEMVDAGRAEGFFESSVRKLWKAMIDAALTGGKGE